MSAILIPRYRKKFGLFDPHQPLTVEDHIRHYEANRGLLVSLACETRPKAISYRDFRVGVALIAWRPRGQDEDLVSYITTMYRIFLGSNFKPNDPEDKKCCAEQVAAFSSRSFGYRQIIGFAVVGEPQADDVSGLVHPTLHPCGMCRRMVGALPEMSEWTRVLTGTPKFSKKRGDHIYTQEFTWGELCKFHAEHASVASQVAQK